MFDGFPFLFYVDFICSLFFGVFEVILTSQVPVCHTFLENPFSGKQSTQEVSVGAGFNKDDPGQRNFLPIRQAQIASSRPQGGQEFDEEVGFEFPSVFLSVFLVGGSCFWARNSSSLASSAFILTLVDKLLKLLSSRY